MKNLKKLALLLVLWPSAAFAADSVDDLIALGVQPPVAKYQGDTLVKKNSTGNLVLPVASTKKLSVTVAGTEAASVNSSGLTVVSNLTTAGLTFSAASAGIVYTPGTLAALGADQAGGALVAAKVTTVTAADGTKGVRLPAAPTVGDEYILINTAAAVLKIYPGTGDAINASAADAAVSVAASVVSQCIATSASQWWCFEGVAP